MLLFVTPSVLWIKLAMKLVGVYSEEDEPAEI